MDSHFVRWAQGTFRSVAQSKASSLRMNVQKTSRRHPLNRCCGVVKNCPTNEITWIKGNTMTIRYSPCTPTAYKPYLCWNLIRRPSIFAKRCSPVQEPWIELFPCKIDWLSSPLNYLNYLTNCFKKPSDSQMFVCDKRTMHKWKSSEHPSKALQQKRPPGYQTPICSRTCFRMAGQMHGQQDSVQPEERRGTKPSNMCMIWI